MKNSKEYYMNNILEPFFQILPEDEKQCAILQYFMEAFHDIFGKMIICQGLWPPHSSDTSV
jgi:hypothetical protein